MTLPRNILMSLLAVVLTVSLIAPHICMDNNNGMAKAEQQQQAKVEKHTQATNITLKQAIIAASHIIAVLLNF